MSEPSTRPAVVRVVAWGLAAVAVAAGAGFGLRAATGQLAAARRATAQVADTVAGSPGPAEQTPPKPEGSALSPEEIARLQKSWLDSESIAPRSDRVDPATGERVGVFHGFGLQIDTVPAGAEVLVAGEEMGTSPLLTTVACRPGEELLVRAQLDRQVASTRTRCRKDVLVKLLLTLRPGR
ncbi:MAG TPA: hypothetical protein VEM76_02070 [Anaeromyxobacteraceae bacterium]|nr:hypothetical protein [Anaeromyxobacteraceae bacterium]